MLRQRVFHIFYNSSYWLLGLVLFCLVLVTPADTIRQAIRNHQLYNVFVIAGAYVLTLFLAMIIWATRIWTTRSVLAAIPKTWIPVEKDDVTKNVRKMIVGSLSSSAVIAWDARPRVQSSPPAPVPEVVADEKVADPVTRPSTSNTQKERALLYKRRASTEKGEGNHVIDIPSNKPVWGEIAHRGWSSPASPDLPNLQYTSVILELPHLIEARAVSVAPRDPESAAEQPLPDIRAVDLLQRPVSMGLRDYIGHLIGIGVITSQLTANEFLSVYEYARFSPRPLGEEEFRNLMKLFADLLRGIQSLSPAVLANLDIDPPESNIDDDASSKSTPRSRSQASDQRSVSIRSFSDGTIRTAFSRPPGTSGTGTTKRVSEFASVATTTPKNYKRILSTSNSVQSFSQTRRPYMGSSSGSSTSLSSSQGSVIRLTPTNDAADLPYTLMIPRSR
jgi:hypothetical protein